MKTGVTHDFATAKGSSLIEDELFSGRWGACSFLALLAGSPKWSSCFSTKGYAEEYYNEHFGDRPSENGLQPAPDPLLTRCGILENEVEMVDRYTSTPGDEIDAWTPWPRIEGLSVLQGDLPLSISICRSDKLKMTFDSVIQARYWNKPFQALEDTVCCR